MPTISQVISACDALIDTVRTKVSAKQDNFFVNRARYWQGFPTHGQHPAHTTSKWGNAVPDRLSGQGGSDYDNWISVTPDLSAVEIPCSFRCDQYTAPDAKGYVLIATFTYNGVSWTKAINVGPRTDFGSDWTESVP